jgi:hypothetical protein
MLGAAASRSSSPHQQTPEVTENSLEDKKLISNEAKKPQTQLSGNRRKLPELDLSKLRRTASLFNNNRLKKHLSTEAKILRCHSLDVATERAISAPKVNAPSSASNNFAMIDYFRRR